MLIAVGDSLRGFVEQAVLLEFGAHLMLQGLLYDRRERLSVGCA